MKEIKTIKRDKRQTGVRKQSTRDSPKSLKKAYFHWGPLGKDGTAEQAENCTKGKS